MRAALGGVLAERHLDCAAILLDNFGMLLPSDPLEPGRVDESQAWLMVGELSQNTDGVAWSPRFSSSMPKI